MSPLKSLDYSNRAELAHIFGRAMGGHQDVLLRPAKESDPIAEFARSVVAGLSRQPRELECRYLYDQRGSELYEQITAQPEYYPARTEAKILGDNADKIARLTGPATLVELGSGYSTKTRHLLSAYTSANAAPTYIPIDVSSSALLEAAESVDNEFEHLQYIGVNGLYEDAFPLLQQIGPKVVVFLGGTIGNFYSREEDLFWSNISRSLSPGDHFLLGVDLHKESSILEPAYNDAAGVTRQFTRNLFARMNRELRSGIRLAALEHVAFYNRSRRRMEIYARFTADQEIMVAPLNRSFNVNAGEEVRIEISRKFSLESLVPKLRSFGLQKRETFMDEKGWFALILLRRGELDGTATA